MMMIMDEDGAWIMIIESLVRETMQSHTVPKAELTRGSRGRRVALWCNKHIQRCSGDRRLKRCNQGGERLASLNNAIQSAPKERRGRLHDARDAVHDTVMVSNSGALQAELLQKIKRQLQ